MFLRIVSEHLYNIPLHIVLGTDEEFYFRAQDIGRLLNYSDPWKFADRYSLLTVRDVIYFGIDLPDTTWKTRIFSKKQLKELSSHLYETIFNILADTTMKANVESRLVASSSIHNAIKIRIGRNLAHSLQNILMTFKVITFELYDHLCPQEQEAHIHSESLETLGYNEPPNHITVFFGDIKINYKIAD